MLFSVNTIGTALVLDFGVDVTFGELSNTRTDVAGAGDPFAGKNGDIPETAGQSSDWCRHRRPCCSLGRHCAITVRWWFGYRHCEELLSDGDCPMEGGT